MKFAVLSDTHYISRRMLLDTADKEAFLQTAVSEFAIETAASRDDIDVILITGDLTDEGDIYSHEDFKAYLEKVREKTGKKIYVTTATHDFHHHKAYVRQKGDTKAQFSSEPWNMPYFDKDNADWHEYLTDECENLSDSECMPGLVRACTPEELWKLYADFGPSDAISVHNDSFCYCVELDDNTRCLMLNDNFRNEEAMHDISVTYTPDCFRWIKSMIDKANREGKYIFACTHHPLLPAAPAHRLYQDERNMRSAYISHTLADMGLNLFITGHTHLADVGCVVSDKGNRLYDITVPAARFFPPRFKVIDLDPMAQTVRYESVDIETPPGYETEESSLTEHYLKKDYEAYSGLVKNLKPPLNSMICSLRLKHLYPLVKKAGKISREEFSPIAETAFTDYILSLVFNMFGGDGKFTPDTPEYKFGMGFAAVFDSIIDAQPFYDVRKKLLRGYSVREIFEPMLFNNSFSDNGGFIDLNKEPVKKYEAADFSSHAGDILVGLITVTALIISKPAATGAALAIPVLSVMKKRREEKNPTKPQRY